MPRRSIAPATAKTKPVRTPQVAKTISATQSLDRAMGLLTHVVDHARGGIALPALAEISGLSKPTAHRLMLGLRNAGLVDYNPGTRRFAPSFKFYRMGLASSVRFSLVELAGPSMDRLAEATGDTVYLSVRSGDQALCVARRIGAYPIKTLTLNVGDMRPLGLGAGSIALLSALDDSEREAVLQRNRDELEQHANFTLDAVRRYCNRARSDGLAINDGLMLPEMAAVAMVVRHRREGVGGAISIAAIRSRLALPRRAQVVRMLRAEVARLEDLLASDASS